MKNSKHLFAITFMILISIGNLIGQECGFQHSEKDIERILELDSKPMKIIRNSSDQVPVTIHIITQSNQQGGIELSKINSALESANEHFDQIKIEFAICGKVNYINNDKFYNLYNNDLVALYEHNVPNTINIYFANGVYSRDSNSLCGFAYFPGYYDVMVMQNGCVDNGSTFIHELGHYFNLLHTHDTRSGIELVNGTNCSTSGDLICDTPADPVLSSKVDSDCRYFGNDRDPNGDAYNPDVQNLMSYSSKSCRNYFTPNQYTRMRKAFDYERNYLICTAQSTETICYTPSIQDINVVERSNSKITVSYTKTASRYSWSFRRSGTTSWITYEDKDWKTFWYTGLDANTTYEFSLKIKCSNGVWSDWSNILRVTTTGAHCPNPSNHDISILERTSSKITVEYNKTASRYSWAFRKYGSSNWITYEDKNWKSFWYSGLEANTTYEFSLKIKCSNGTWSDWSSILKVTTTGGHCQTPSVYDIEVVERTSSKITVKYSRTALRYSWAFRKYGTSTWTLYENKDWKSFWYAGLSSNTTYEFALKIKCSSGIWSEWSKIKKVTTSGNHCHTPSVYDIRVVERTSSKISVRYDKTASRYTWAFRKYGTSNWTIYENKDWRTFWHTGLYSNTTYEIALKIKCSSGTWSEWSKIKKVTTKSHSAYDTNESGDTNGSNDSLENINDELQLKVFPNPATDYIQLDGEYKSLNGQILDISGKIVQSINEIQLNQKIDVHQLRPGSYIIQMMNEKGEKITKKFMVTK